MAVVTLALVASAGPAAADTKPGRGGSPTAPSGVLTTTTTLDPNGYAGQMAAYKAAQAQINQTFHDSLTAARSALRRALNGATSDQKVQANADYVMAVASATSARTAALAALGPSPHDVAVAAIKSWQVSNQAIKATFEQAKDQARADYQMALAAAASASQRAAAKLALSAALSAAAAARDLALSQLGPRPTIGN